MVLRNKLDEPRDMARTKTRLMANSYNQQETIDYDEAFALVVVLEAIKMSLEFAYFMDIKLHQMDVKSTFLNGYLHDVYVKQLYI